MARVKVVAAHRLVRMIALTLVIVGASRESQAGTVVVTTRLDYAAAPECPSVAIFETVVTGRLGYDPFRADARDQVVVRIEPSGRALEGRIEWRNVGGGSIGEQAFPSRTGDCAELTRAMGFALALQIQLMAATVEETVSPAAAAAAPVPTMAPKPAPTLVTAPSPPAPLANGASGTPESPARWRGPSVLVGAGVSAGVGLSSDLIGLGRLFATAGWSHVAVELGGEVNFPSTTHRSDGAGFSQEEFLASLAGCGVSSPWSACAVAKFGELRVVGQGVDVPLTASGLMIQAGLRLAASHALGGNTYIIAHAEGLGRLTQGTITLDSTPAWTTPRFAGVLGLDVAVRFR